MKGIQTIASLAAVVALGVFCTSCSSPPTDDVPIKTGTDTLPQAPNQGTPPGQIDSSGQPTGPGAGLSLPGNKSGK